AGTTTPFAAPPWPRVTLPGLAVADPDATDELIGLEWSEWMTERSATHRGEESHEEAHRRAVHLARRRRRGARPVALPALQRRDGRRRGRHPRCGRHHPARSQDLGQLHLLVHPIAVRKGMRLLDEGEPPIPLTRPPHGRLWYQRVCWTHCSSCSRAATTC